MAEIIEYKCTECDAIVKGKDASRKMKEKLICEKCLLKHYIGVDNVWKSRIEK